MKGFSSHFLPEQARDVSAREPAQVDRRAFNYARGLPWDRATERGQNPPQEYVRTELLRAAIAKRQIILSGAEWALSEALGFVRTADTPEEYQRALSDLARVRAANDPLGIDGTFNQANMPDNAARLPDGRHDRGWPKQSPAEPIGDAGNGHTFFDGCGS